jgi:hypothetical protein
MQLSRSFSLAELTRSEVAARRGWSNTPDGAAIENLRALCANVLQPLRDGLGRPLRVNSGFRSAPVNRAAGSTMTSQHVRGEAADIECAGVPNMRLAQTILDLGLPFDQLILEFHVVGEPSSGWVHVSHRLDGLQRGEVLRAVRLPGGVSYLPGLS